MRPVYLSKPAVFCCCARNSEELWNAVISGNQDGIRKVTALNGKEFFAARISDELLQEKSSARFDMRIMRIEDKCLSQLAQLVEGAKKSYGANRIGVC